MRYQEPGFPALLHWIPARVRSRLAGTAWSSPAPTTPTGNPGRATPYRVALPVAALVCCRAPASCRCFGWWLTFVQRDHGRGRGVGIEGRIVSDGSADYRHNLQRGLHIDREVRLLALLVVFRDRYLNRVSRCRNHRARHLNTSALHGVPNLLSVFRLAVEEDEFLISQAERLQVWSGGNRLRGKVGG